MSFEFPALPANLYVPPAGWIYVGPGPIPWTPVFEKYDNTWPLTDNVGSCMNSDPVWDLGGYYGTGDDVHYIVRENSELHQYLLSLSEESTEQLTTFEF